MALTWTELDSSHLKRVGFDPDLEAMTVEFTNGSRGTYQNVPPEKHEDFLAADSKGAFLHANFVGNSDHTYTKHGRGDL